MKNIHLLPTDKPTRLFTSDSELILTGYPVTTFKTGKHIYITFDEDIKSGDLFLTQKNTICKCIKVDEKYTYSIESGSIIKNNCKKIILTTDQDLIKDGVQAIDDEFLEWFVKNPSCERVEINYEIYKKLVGLITSDWRISKDDKYKIVIPKEEPKTKCYCGHTSYCDCIPLEPKQETLEEEFDEQIEQLRERGITITYINKQETLEEFVFKVPFNYNIKPKEVIDMCMKEQENIILTWRLGHFIDMINSLPDDTEKNRILKSVFNNRQGELLLESYKSMKLHYEK